MLIHKLFLDDIAKVFNIDSYGSLVQIASVSCNSIPKCRTVLMMYSKKHMSFFLCCSIRTSKWNDIKHNNKVTIIKLEEQKNIQYRFEASCTLIEKNNSDEYEFFKNQWLNLHIDLRHIKWKEYCSFKKIEMIYDVNQICPDHGIIMIKPYYWDIFHLNTSNCYESKRDQMIFNNNKWSIYEDTPIIHPLNININNKEKGYFLS